MKQFWKSAYAQGAVKVGISGDVSDAMTASLTQALGSLPAGPGLPATVKPVGRKANGPEVEIIEKNTRATAISFGLPEVTRHAPGDFPPCGWQRPGWASIAPRILICTSIREIRGMNYGDYAYIEAFPRGMYQFFPDPNLGRKAQLFEIWIQVLN